MGALRGALFRRDETPARFRLKMRTHSTINPRRLIVTRKIRKRGKLKTTTHSTINPIKIKIKIKINRKKSLVDHKTEHTISQLGLITRKSRTEHQTEQRTKGTIPSLRLIEASLILRREFKGGVPTGTCGACSPIFEKLPTFHTVTFWNFLKNLKIRWCSPNIENKMPPLGAS